MVCVTRRLAVSLVLVAGTFSSMATTASGAPPANDEAANATVISSLPFSGTVDTTEATIGPEDVTGSAACGLSTPFPKSVFYQYTPSTDQVVRVDVSQSSYSAGVGVFAGGACVTTFAGFGTFSAIAGQSYRIAVVDIGADGNGGTLRLAVAALEPPGEPTIALPRHAKLAQGGAAVSVSVRYSCEGGFPAFLGVQLTQRHGRRVAQGVGYEFSPFCDGECHRADVIVVSSADESGQAVPFKPGKAVATATLDQFADPFGALHAQDGPHKIQLRKK